MSGKVEIRVTDVKICLARAISWSHLCVQDLRHEPRKVPSEETVARDQQVEKCVRLLRGQDAVDAPMLDHCERP